MTLLAIQPGWWRRKRLLDAVKMFDCCVEGQMKNRYRCLGIEVGFLGFVTALTQDHRQTASVIAARFVRSLDVLNANPIWTVKPTR